MSTIARVEVHGFRYSVPGIGTWIDPASGVEVIVSDPDGDAEFFRYGVVIETEDGARGEYVAYWGGDQSSWGQTLMCAPLLIGRDATHRLQILDVLAHHLRAQDQRGLGPIDLALWDLEGKQLGVSVKRLLGGFRDRLPTYASTYQGQRDGRGFSSFDTYRAFAKDCKDRGFPAIKLHAWTDGDGRREADNLLAVRDAIGDDMALMVDPGSTLRTFDDALMVGRACDEASAFWLEDPFRDGSVSIEAHRRLRESIRTPLLLGEHIRGLQQTADFALSGATDMLHIDPEYDLGLTGTMKMAALAESIGMDVQIHATGPAARHAVAAIPHTHFYEMALVGPDMPNVEPPVYADGYHDQLDAIDSEGTVEVPTGPGMGVTYDWDRIASMRTDLQVFT